MIDNQATSQGAPKRDFFSSFDLFTNPNKPIPEWKGFSMGPVDDKPGMYGEADSGATVLMGHFLVIFSVAVSNRKKIWTVDLRDNRVQQKMCPIKRIYDGSIFSLHNYGDNQILQYGENGLIWITIDSFNPLEITCEEVQGENFPKLSQHTSAIYQDCLYVFGVKNGDISFSQFLDMMSRKEEKKEPSNELWCFDLKKRTWKSCETTGEAPRPRDGAKSFVIDDNLYTYGVCSEEFEDGVSYKELFELNLKSMEWRKIEQKDPEEGQEDFKFFDRLSVNPYGDNMLVVKNERKKGYDLLYRCNRHTLGSWSLIDVAIYGGQTLIGNAVIYENMLFACFANKKGTLYLNFVDLNRLGLPPPPRSPEEEHVSSLFMSENESDVKLKIGDKIIPAHKKVLISKSKFFANLFNSDMMESRQEIIDISDCEYDIFQEFLRFLYRGEICDADFDYAFKILQLADKYVQEDLSYKCAFIMVHYVNAGNVSSKLDFAREKNIRLLESWCLKYLQDSDPILKKAK